MTERRLPLLLGVARRGDPEEAHAVRWGMIERETGLTESLAYAARAVVRARALGLPDDRVAPAYRRAVAADAPLSAFLACTDDFQRLRREMRAPTAAVMRWRRVGESLLESA